MVRDILTSVCQNLLDAGPGSASMCASALGSAADPAKLAKRLDFADGTCRLRHRFNGGWSWPPRGLEAPPEQILAAACLPC